MPLGSFRFSVRDLLLLFAHKKDVVIPFFDAPTFLVNSPVNGSTLITSAPWSPNIIVHTGPEIIAVKSITVIPDNGPLFFIFYSFLFFLIF